MNAKGIVRDIARVAGYPVSVGDKIAGLIPKDPKMTLDKAWDSNPDLQNFINSDPGYQKLWKIARRLEGTKRPPPHTPADISRLRYHVRICSRYPSIRKPDIWSASTT